MNKHEDEDDDATVILSDEEKSSILDKHKKPGDQSDQETEQGNKDAYKPG